MARYVDWFFLSKRTVGEASGTDKHIDTREWDDLRGGYVFQFPENAMHSPGPKKQEVFKTNQKPFPYLMVSDNIKLASNQGKKRVSESTIHSNNKRFEYFLEPMHNNVSKRLDYGKARSMIFGTSLPDLRSEWIGSKKETTGFLANLAINTDDAVTFIFNGLLYPFHFIAQAVQIGFQLLATPTMLVRMAFDAAKESKNLGSRIGYGFLSVCAAIVTLPCQIAAVAANTIKYSRHVVDGVVTFARAAINAGINYIQLGFSNFSNNEEYKKERLEKIEKNKEVMGYAAKDTLKNAFNLLPIAASLVIAHFTGGLSLITQNFAMAIGYDLPQHVVYNSQLILNSALTVLQQATLYSFVSQGLSLCRIKVNDKLADLGDWFKRKTETELPVSQKGSGNSLNSDMKIQNGLGGCQKRNNTDAKDQLPRSSNEKTNNSKDTQPAPVTTFEGSGEVNNGSNPHPKF